MKEINMEKDTCVECGKKFKPKNYKQIYCNDPCDHNTVRGKNARLKYWYITTIRALFRKMYMSNPNEALKLKEQMEKEEGPEFVDMVLDGMIETHEFKHLSKIYNKYNLRD